MADEFWVVWKSGGDRPNVKHHSEAEALREAERLAALNPGKRYYVLKSVACKGDVSPRGEIMGGGTGGNNGGT